jgi:HK97 family phage major capsid protein
MKPIAEQIAAFEARRASLVAANAQIMEKAGDDGTTLDAEQKEAFDNNAADIKEIDDHLDRLRSVEIVNVAAAKPVARSISSIIQVPARAAVTIKQEVAKGTAFTRYLMALVAAKGNRLEALDIVRGRKQWMETTPEVELALSSSENMQKAAVTPGTIGDADWAQPLVAYRQMADQLVELLRPATIIGRIPGLRRVPFMVKIPVVTQGSLVNWVGEAAPKPVGEMKFGQVTLEVNKVAGIVVLSEELVRLSSPSAEETVRTDLVNQVTQFLDIEFIDPANAAVAGVSPASILNGVTGIPSAGPSAQDARTDLGALIGAFIGSNLGLSDSVFITTETIALQLGMLQNPLGQPEFAGVGLSGGTLLQRPVIASSAVPAGILALVKASEILLADDGGVTIDVSREATLQMDSAPVAANPATLNLWQNNLVGIRAERWITWKRRRDAAVAYITGADYAGVSVTP